MGRTLAARRWYYLWRYFNPHWFNPYRLLNDRGGLNDRDGRGYRDESRDLARSWVNFKSHKLTTAGFRLYRLSKICCGYDCLCLIFGFAKIITFEFQSPSVDREGWFRKYCSSCDKY